MRHDTTREIAAATAPLHAEIATLRAKLGTISALDSIADQRRDEAIAERDRAFAEIDRIRAQEHGRWLKLEAEIDVKDAEIARLKRRIRRLKRQRNNASATAKEMAQSVVTLTAQNEALTAELYAEKGDPVVIVPRGSIHLSSPWLAADGGID